MSITFSDVVDAMSRARRQGFIPSKIVLTDDSIATFIEEDTIDSPKERERRENMEFSMEVVTGDRNRLVVESGKSFEL